jgi:hypothetical protein
MTRILWREPVDGRHVSEVPMVLPHTVSDREVKRQISMVARPVNLVYQWWSFACSPDALAMTAGAVGLK